MLFLVSKDLAVEPVLKPFASQHWHSATFSTSSSTSIAPIQFSHLFEGSDMLFIPPKKKKKGLSSNVWQRFLPAWCMDAENKDAFVVRPQVEAPATKIIAAGLIWNKSVCYAIDVFLVFKKKKKKDWSPNLDNLDNPLLLSRFVVSLFPDFGNLSELLCVRQSVRPLGRRQIAQKCLMWWPEHRFVKSWSSNRLQSDWITFFFSVTAWRMSSKKVRNVIVPNSHTVPATLI